MQKITRLNLTDLKELVAEKYGCNPSDITVSICEASDDGPYHQSACVFFEFESNK